MKNTRPVLWSPKMDVRVPEGSVRIGSILESAEIPGAVIGVDRRKLYEFPFLLTVDAPGQAVSAAANGSSTLVNMRVSPEAPAEIVALSLLRTGVGLVMMQVMDGITPRSLSNGPLHVDTVFGSNTLPLRLPEAIYIPEGRSIDFRFTDLSGSANTFRPILHCARYSSPLFDQRLVNVRQRLQEKQFLSMPFFYTNPAGAISLTGNGSAQVNMTVGPDHHFELHKIVGTATSNLYNLNIQNGSTGKSIIDGPAQQNFPVSAGLIVGTNTYPFTLPEPKFFEAGSNILLTLEDYSGDTNSVYLTLVGKIIAKMMER